MKSKSVNFETPLPQNQCKMYRYGNMIDLEVKLIDKAPHIGNYKKVSKYEMLDTRNNRTIHITPKDKKSQKAVFKSGKNACRVIVENFGRWCK